MKPLLTLHDPRAARHFYEAGLWTEDTFYSLLAGNARRRPEAWAARDSERRLNWRQLQGWVDAVAAHLHERGLRAGERVSLWASNRLEVLVTFLACARNGYVCNPSLHQNYAGEEILTLLQRIRAAGLIAEEGYGADAGRRDVAAEAAALPGMRAVINLPAGRKPGEAFPGMDATAGNAPAADGNPDNVSYLAFTSGTTGMPKGVMHSDNTLMANARDMVAGWGHDENTVLLSLSPLSHHIAWVAVAQALIAGAELVINDPPDGMHALDWIAESGATYVMGVPTHAIDIQAEQRRRGMARIGAVKVFYMAGSPIPPATAQGFLDQGIVPQNVYGMSENSSHQYTWPDDGRETVVATCGRGGKAYEVRIFERDNADVEAAAGEVGQIGGRGACLMLGYFDNQQATEDSFNRDGWFLSGDLGRLDARGCLQIAGRMKDLVIRGGHNIYPARIEDLAIKHPGIGKAAGFGVADERLGEKLCLAILPAATGAPAADAVLEHLFRQGLSKYDMPEFFLSLDEFPLTASGKILKRDLSAMVLSGVLTPTPVRFLEPDKQ